MARGAVRRAALFAATIGSVFIASEPAALANGRFPAANALVSTPGDSSHLALRATYGVLLSSDGGATWDWLCERAMGYGGNEDPSLVIAGNGAILVGAFDGIRRSTDGGCNFAHDASWPSAVVDLTTRPSAPDRIYAVSCRFSSDGDSGISYASQLFVSGNDGASWTVRSTLDPSLSIDSVEVAPSDPARVYVSALRSRGGKTTGVLLASSDDGGHWKETVVPFALGERGVYIAAVDPGNPSRLYLRTNGVETSRLLSSNDAGKTIKEIFHGASLQGFALSDDGATLFTGGPTDGLYLGSSKDDHFTKISAAPVRCLTSLGSALWGCASSTAGYVLGVSLDRGASFAPKLTLAGMRGPLQCASPSALDVCGPDWSAVKSLVGSSENADASTTTPDAPALTKPAPEKKSTFGCALARGPNDVGGMASLLLAVLALARRARYFRRN